MAKGTGSKANNQKRARKRTLTLLGGVALLLLLALAGFLLSDALERRAYRLDYPQEVAHSAAEFGLDPYLVAAVIHCESGNNHHAVSRRGATGLMQIMPDTGAWIAEKLEIADYDEAMLEEPADNIRMGCWYLGYLSGKYGGDAVKMLAAYNAGPGNVDKWLADVRYCTDGALSEIPFEETKNYVSRVQRAREIYERLYEIDTAK